MNLAIPGILGDYPLEPEGTLKTQSLPGLSDFDFIPGKSRRSTFLNWDGDQLREESALEIRHAAGWATRNLLWISHVPSSVLSRQTALLGVVMANGSILRLQSGELEIRKAMGPVQDCS